MKDDFKKAGNKSCAVGGWNCRCCGPKRSERDSFRRTARRRLKQWDKEESQ